MSQKTNNRPLHDRSKHLNENENQSLIQLIEREDGVTLATAAIQLWLSRPPRHTEWFKENTGIICFVKDYTRKSYFFRLYSLSPKQLWEQELYTPFSYNKLTSNFHYFASDQSNAGFNFAFSDEAEKFYQIVTEKIMSKNNKKRTSNVQNVGNSGDNGGLAAKTANLSNPNIPSQQRPLASQPVNLNLAPQTREQPQQQQSSLSNTIGSKFNSVRGKNKKKIDKSEISGPTGFRVVQHVGLSDNKYDINLATQDDPTAKKMREMLSEIMPGIKMTKKTEQFINNFIADHGGYQTLDQELRQINDKKSQAPRANMHPAPPQPPSFQSSNPMPPSHVALNAPPPPPPPPPSQTQYPPQQQHQYSPNNQPKAPVLPPKPSAAAPPSHPPPPPPPPPPPLPPILNNRSNNLQEVTIHGDNSKPNPGSSAASSAPAPPPPPPPPPLPPNSFFTDSKPVKPSGNSGPPPPPPPPLPSDFSSGSSSLSSSTASTARTETPIQPSNAPDPRQNLLDSIKSFQGFKNTNAVSNAPATRVSDPPPATEGSILDQLKNELLKRAQFLNDSSDEGSDDSDSEWK